MKAPWQKSMTEMSKYDWLTAVGLDLSFKHQPLILRVANVLMQFADPETMIAWPSQATIALYAGVADQRQIRHAVGRLAFRERDDDHAAVIKCRINDLPEEVRSTVERQAKGKAYRLDMFWALETLEASQSPFRAEPRQLSRRRTTPVLSEPDRTTAVLSEDDAHRTTAVLLDRTTAVLSTPDYDSPPYTKGILRDTKEGSEEKENLALTRAREIPAPDSYLAGLRRAAEFNT